MGSKNYVLRMTRPRRTMGVMLTQVSRITGLASKTCLVKLVKVYPGLNDQCLYIIYVTSYATNLTHAIQLTLTFFCAHSTANDLPI
jgi:hypothetical protein